MHVFLFVLIFKCFYTVNAVPIESESSFRDTCKCIAYQNCPWGLKMYNLINGGGDGRLRRIFQTNICDRKNLYVWCCENEEGESEYPIFEDLAFLNEKNNHPNESEDTDQESGRWKPNAKRFECGDSIATEHITGGKVAKVGGFPYMAIIGYENKGENGQEVKYECGGSVINKWYILTAAHCMYDNEAPAGTRKHPVEVTVGQYDLRSKEYCFSNGQCTPDSITIKITNPLKQVIVHEDYINDNTSLKNDISLIRLDRKLTLYTDDPKISYVKPVCLPWLKYDKISDVQFARNIDGLEGKFATITGWGLFGYGSKKIEKAFDNTRKCGASACRLLFGNTQINNIGCKEKFPSAFDPKVHLCAGKKETDASTCQGDSGGPLVISSSPGGRRFQIGIVSFGTDLSCKQETRFFTRLQSFLPWIEKKLEP